jgi:peptide/nickel transport system substrate-binding protein
MPRVSAHFPPRLRPRPRKLLIIPHLALFLLYTLAAVAWGASGSLRVIDSSTEPLTLHPHRSFDQYSDVIISQIYEGLVDYDADGRLVPRLAVRWQELSPTRYRFWLRKGVRFHNGEPFDAHAVRFSVDHALRGHPQAANAMVFDPDLRVEVIDQYTVDLVTNFPDARFPSTLPMFMMMVPPKYLAEVGDDGLERHPVGTGPYRFLDRTRGHSIRLTANKDYWQPGLPRIKDVTFLFVPRGQQFDALMQGRADLVTKLRGSDCFPVMTGPNTRVTKRQEAVALWVSLKNHDSPFADRRVRQAVSYAVNREHLIEYVDKGSSASVSTLSSVIEKGYNAALRPYPFDLERARRLLAEAGYPHGFKVRALVSEDTADMVRAIKAQLKMVGVELDLTIVPWEKFLRLVIEKNRIGKPARDWDMTAWVTSNPTLNAFFMPMALFYSKSPYSIMHDPAFDQMYLSYVREANPVLRQEKLNKLQARALSEAYGIYIAQRVQIFGLHWDLSIENNPTGMLTGRTLAEAFWKEHPDSLWDESSQSEKRKMRGGNETRNRK